MLVDVSGMYNDLLLLLLLLLLILSLVPNPVAAFWVLDFVFFLLGDLLAKASMDGSDNNNSSDNNICVALHKKQL